VKESWVFADLRELKEIFAAFHEASGRVLRLPWIAEPQEDSLVLRRQLAKLASEGLLAINAQPRVNGALSSDPVVGWGPDAGYVYQRAYVEFFCSPKDMETIITALDSRKGNSLTYIAATAAGQVHASCPPGTVITATWGMFPNLEVKQPCVVDFESFLVWKDEAFALWDEWSDVFPDVDAQQRLVIHEIQSTWFLVSVIDNDYVGGDLFSKLTCLTSSL
jgi:methylenetetrahydrofolate reductase (NADPH)